MQQTVDLVLVCNDLTRLGCPSLAGVRAESIPQRFKGKRLQNVLHDTDPGCRLNGRDLARRSHHHDVSLVARGTHSPYDVKPVAVRQVHVEEHQVDRLPTEYLECTRRSTGNS
jgi:hypothetical protein